MNSAHLIRIAFTGVGLHAGFRGDEWYAHRIEIFKNYTLKSLANQSNKNFAIWCTFRAEERSNPLTETIREAIEATGIPYVFTFHGLPYFDDKFSNYTLKTKLKNLLQMLWDSYHHGRKRSLREMWLHTWEDKNKTLPARLEKTLETLKIEMGTDYQWVYVTQIDSDDMFHKDAVDLIQSHEPAYKKALVMDKGYMYNVVTGQLGEWLPPTCPPFSTVIFPANVFFNPQSYLEYYGAFRTHEDISKVFRAETLDMYKYCVTAHGKHHISTSWDVPLPKRVYHKYKYARPYCYTTSGQNISTHWRSKTLKRKNFMLGKEFTDPQEKRQIMADFGIEI